MSNDVAAMTESTAAGGPAGDDTFDWSQPAVVGLVTDRFFAMRLTDVIRGQGGYGVTVATADELLAAVERYFPVLILVDLGVEREWQRAIRAAKVQVHTRQIPLYAFGNHVDVAALQAARQAGADHAWARSRMMTELVTVVDQHLHPATLYPAGWDEPPSPLAQQGIAEFNQGEYFEQHEHLEAAWLAEKRPIRDFYQGILQVGVALLQIERRNWRGALKLFRRGLPKLRPLPAVCQGIDLQRFRTAAEALHAEVAQRGPTRVHEFDRRHFPEITYVTPPPLAESPVDGE